MANQWDSIVHEERYLRCLRELHISVVNFTSTLEALQTSRPSSYTHERLRHLNWENPGEQEFETVSNIRKRIQELINENSLNGMTTLPLQLLKDVLGLLWTFLLFHQGDGAETDGTSSQYLEQEWATVMSDRGLEETCAFVANTFLHEKESLQVNGTYEGTTTLNKALAEMIDFLKKITQPSETPMSYANDRAMEDLHWILK